MSNIAKDALQGGKFDRILKENLRINLPRILENVLGMRIAESKDLSTDLQYTKERRPDLLKRVVDHTGKDFILHVEYQSTNDKLMACRMADYNVMVRRSYQVDDPHTIKQYVIYIGPGQATMSTTIKGTELKYHYNLINFSAIDYELFLNSDQPEDQILAILGDLKDKDPKEVLKHILIKLHAVARGELTNNKYVNQLHILSQLRNLEDDFEKITIMEPISSFFKLEKDPFFKKGIDQGMQQGIDRGMQLATINNAREMKNEGISLETIVKVTKLSEEEVQKL